MHNYEPKQDVKQEPN